MNEDKLDRKDLYSLLEAIYKVYHYDFREYTEASILRRVRSALQFFRCESILVLKDQVLKDPRLFSELLRFLTVQVSELFRDPSYFFAVRKKVVPYLKTYPSLKIWVAGCATGEEAYSLAILFAEEGLLSRTLIYATDIHAGSLQIANEGVYDLRRFARFSENYQQAGGTSSLADYYTARYASVLIDPQLRKSILFSDHSLATDSPFAEVEFVSCRNVLIYFKKNLQDKAIGVLRDSLCRKGFLGLGARETLRFSKHKDSFRDFIYEDRIYQRM